MIMMVRVVIVLAVAVADTVEELQSFHFFSSSNNKAVMATRMRRI